MTTDRREQLLQATGQGDAAAFRALYDDTSAQLFGVLVRMLKRRELADEVLQDVFVSVWNKASGYRASQGRAITWMVSIARNRAVDVLRKTQRETPMEPAVAEQIPAAPDFGIDPARFADEIGRAEKLYECMGKLSPDQLQSIRLAYFEGFSHSELAERLAKPLGTVKSWVRRGMDQLKDCLSR